MLKETEQKRAKLKKRKSRHIPCPDWMQNVAVTRKTSQFHETNVASM